MLRLSIKRSLLVYALFVGSQIVAMPCGIGSIVSEGSKERYYTVKTDAVLGLLAGSVAAAKAAGPNRLSMWFNIALTGINTGLAGLNLVVTDKVKKMLGNLDAQVAANHQQSMDAHSITRTQLAQVKADLEAQLARNKQSQITYARRVARLFAGKGTQAIASIKTNMQTLAKNLETKIEANEAKLSTKIDQQAAKIMAEVQSVGSKADGLVNKTDVIHELIKQMKAEMNDPSWWKKVLRFVLRSMPK